MKTLVLLGLLLATAPVVDAKSPTVQERREGAPYVLLPFDFTEFTIPLRAQPYSLMVENRGAEPVEYKILINGSTRAQGTVRYEGDRRIELDRDGVYTVQLDGRGVLAFLEADLVQGMGGPRAWSNRTIEERVGFSLGHSLKNERLCLQADGPVDVQLHTDGFQEVERRSHVHRFNATFDSRAVFHSLFVQAQAPVRIQAYSGPAPCPFPWESQQAGDPSPRIVVPGPPAFAAVGASLVGFAALRMRRAT
jgi:hypothetical protein